MGSITVYKINLACEEEPVQIHYRPLHEVGTYIEAVTMCRGIYVWKFVAIVALSLTNIIEERSYTIFCAVSSGIPNPKKYLVALGCNEMSMLDHRTDEIITEAQIHV
jgi:hypothetical protein